jgi:hypothetical protein
MRWTRSPAGLQQHQHHVYRLLENGTTVLNAGSPPTLSVLLALRMEIAAALNAYQALKHNNIFDPAVASGSAQRATLGRAMKVECIVAGELFHNHLRRWNEANIQASWDDHIIALGLVLEQLRHHIEQERNGIRRLMRAA